MAERRVLIVDDDSDGLKLRGFLLQRVGFEPLAATGVQMALDYLQQHQLDLVISDGNMADGHGIELLHGMKDHPEWNHIPFLLHDSWTMVDESFRTRNDGIDDFIPQPTHPAELLICVDRLLTRVVSWRTTERVQRVLAVESYKATLAERKTAAYFRLGLPFEERLKTDLPFYDLAGKLHPEGYIVDMTTPDQLTTSLIISEPGCLVVTDVETLIRVRAVEQAALLPVICLDIASPSISRWAELYRLGADEIASKNDDSLVRAVKAVHAM
jgi:CheY-like chemotaxis protein